MGEEITEEQAEQLLRNFAEAKETAHSFFTKVIQEKDSTKIGNLTDDELGISTLPARSYKELALFSYDICKDNSWGDYFSKMGEIQFASSLSKYGFLLRLVGTQRKEIADLTPKQKKNSGWFKKNKDKDNQGEQ
jgi:hypothetical protein